MIKLFNKYNGEFGSLEVDFEEKRVNDAIQWNMIADKAKNNTSEFIHITRKMLNELFDSERIEFALTNEKALKSKVESYLNSGEDEGGMEVSVTYDNREYFNLHLNFNNESSVD
ncbi:hypothetical protein [Clostridium ganghwense]|uniref:DUF2634 domain-containing protein n=1 Tax=Clostridium ganghwense TaxID=312089 RepID=A0ABT4CKZ6_9CLOT|nr:hypothetical protein [Clostridium ganghwense]MCY6369163.1 hypothetical protein [Clostridium ganghwense]